MRLVTTLLCGAFILAAPFLIVAVTIVSGGVLFFPALVLFGGACWALTRDED